MPAASTCNCFSRYGQSWRRVQLAQLYTVLCFDSCDGASATRKPSTTGRLMLGDNDRLQNSFYVGFERALLLRVLRGNTTVLQAMTTMTVAKM